MSKSFDMNYVNCALLVVVLILVVVCCVTKSNSPSACVPVEHFGLWSTLRSAFKRNARHASRPFTKRGWR